MLIEQPFNMEDNSKMDDVVKGERQTSFRRRKNGAFVRPNLIDVVGQPKFKTSEINSNESGSEDRNEECCHDQRDDIKESISARNALVDNKMIENIEQNGKNHGKLKEDYIKELDNLTNLLRSLIVKEFDVLPEENAEPNTERRNSESKGFPETKRKRSQSQKEIRFGRVIQWKDDVDEDDHVMVQLPLTPQKEKRFLNDNDRKKCISRTRSLPETKRGKSKFSGLLSFGKGRHSNASNHVYISSDGEGSGQSMMSFASTSSSSSHGRRSRSGSLLSRSRTCSSPMSDKRSRAGSLIANRTGCPQYFIPGENRGRVFMEPLDLFQTQTVCIKGISFRIMKDMPRTHRAVSMIGCMGFIVPAPSKYFER